MHLFSDYSHNAPKCEPRPSGIHGVGLFAKAKIRVGETLMTLPGGKIVPVSSYFENEAGLVDDEWNAISEKELLVREHRTCYYFINHQFSPNAAVDIRHRRVVALFDIAPGEEITLDYTWEPLPNIYFETWGATYLRRARPEIRGSLRLSLLARRKESGWTFCAEYPAIWFAVRFPRA